MSRNPSAPDFSVFGAGLAGPLIAALLAKAGYRVRLWEMRGDPRRERQAEGKSINLALSRRGLRALELVGLADRARSMAVPMRGRMMHAVDGALSFQPYGTEAHHVLHSISRGGLNRVLLDAAEAAGVETTFHHKLLQAHLDRGEAVLETEQGAVTVPTGRIVGADGAFSRVRSAMQRRGRFNYRQDYLEHGYKELVMPAGADGGFVMEPNALHIWPRRTYMMIALPNDDGSYTVTLFWPFRGAHSFDSIREPEAIRSMFERTFPDAVPLIPDLVQQFQENPVGSLVTVRCFPWRYQDRAVLLGDACHAVVPFYGQGMNAAFEDCTVLQECLETHGSNWERVFTAYENRRKEHVDALADLALHNFVEMRDLVGTRRFLLRKGLERWLTRLFPAWYTPLYTLITFSDVPYADARRRAAAQDRWIAWGAAVLLALAALAAVLALTGAARLHFSR